MLTVAMLQDYGANTAEGLSRCMGNEAFYLRLVGMAGKDNSFAKLEEAIAQNNLDAAFEAAHALKGVLANLSLTPALTPVSELTELLRSRTEMDYGPLMATAKAEMERLMTLING